MAEHDNDKTSTRLLKRFVAPIAAAAASAAASHFAKKAPAFFENTVLPKLRDATSGAGGAAGSAAEKVPARARAAASSVGDIADDLTSRAKAVVSSGSSAVQDATRSRRDGFSADELEQRRAQRAAAREQRRKSSRR